MALSVPLARFTPRVGGGSAFFVRCHSRYDFFHAPFADCVSNRKTRQQPDRKLHPKPLNAHIFTKPRLQSFKSITTWGGVAANFGGILVSYFTSRNLAGAGLSAFGLLLICCGHWVSGEIAKHQAVERAAEKQYLDELESRFQKSEADAESASYYYQEQIESMEKRMRDWSLRFDEPYDLD
jgi:hypothetical protein